jgi:hypothetical protein
MSQCQKSFLTPIFFISPEIGLLERPLSHKTGPKGRGRVESVQEMGTVETVMGIRNGIQVHSSFHTDVKEMEYKDLLTNIFTQNWGQNMVIFSVWFAHTGRIYPLDQIECHMDPTINTESTGKERTVRVCAVSESSVRGPLRARYMTVLGEIRAKIQSDKTTMFESADTEKKRLLQMV